MRCSLVEPQVAGRSTQATDMSRLSLGQQVVHRLQGPELQPEAQSRGYASSSAESAKNRTSIALRFRRHFDDSELQAPEHSAAPPAIPASAP